MAMLSAPAALAEHQAASFSSPSEALRQGVSAYQGGYYEIAVPALQYAAAADDFMANYYLARIYQDNGSPYTDHAKAYALFEKIADDHLDADPDDPRALYVGRALTALAGYLLRGLPEIGLAADPDRAVFYLKNASTSFNDEDAQFELAKVFLRGEGPDLAMRARGEESKIENGIHWLSRLSKKGHAGAQAFLADLLWRGKFVPQDQIAALNLIDVAVANASPNERLWIEDIYQNIFCNAGEGVRQQATGRVAEWRNRYGRHHEGVVDKDGLDLLSADPVRTCANGEPVKPIGDTGDSLAPPAGGRVLQLPPRPGRGVERGLRDVGVGFAPSN